MESRQDDTLWVGYNLYEESFVYSNMNDHVIANRLLENLSAEVQDMIKITGKELRSLGHKYYVFQSSGLDIVVTIFLSADKYVDYLDRMDFVEEREFFNRKLQLARKLNTDYPPSAGTLSEAQTALVSTQQLLKMAMFKLFSEKNNLTKVLIDDTLKLLSCQFIEKPGQEGYEQSIDHWYQKVSKYPQDDCVQALMLTYEAIQGLLASEFMGLVPLKDAKHLVGKAARMGSGFCSFKAVQIIDRCLEEKLKDDYIISLIEEAGVPGSADTIKDWIKKRVVIRGFQRKKGRISAQEDLRQKECYEKIKKEINQMGDGTS